MPGVVKLQKHRRTKCNNGVALMPSSYFLHSVCRSVFPTFPHPTHQPSKPPSQTQPPCRTPLLVVAAITPWWPMVPASRRQEVDLETSASSSAPGTPQSPSSSRLGAGQQQQQQQEENEGEEEHHQYSSTPFVAWSTTPLFTTFRRVGGGSRETGCMTCV